MPEPAELETNQDTMQSVQEDLQMIEVVRTHILFRNGPATTHCMPSRVTETRSVLK